MIGSSVYFKLPGMPRARKGTLTGGNADGWLVQARRLSTQLVSYAGDVFTVPAQHLRTFSEHQTAQQPSGIYETTSTNGRRITAEEMNKRADVATERFQLTEAQVMQARAMIELRRRILRKLASTNGFSTADFDFEELTSEFLIATLSAYRTATSKAPVEYLAEFRDHLEGRSDRSRIMASIARTGKTAAIRYLKARAEYQRRHVDIFDYSERLAA